MSDAYLMLGETPGHVRSGSSVRPPLAEAWSIATVPAGFSGALLAAGGMVFAPNEGGALVALEADSGRRVWTYPWRSAAMFIEDGRIFTAVANEIHLVDMHTGRPEACIPHRESQTAIGTGSLLITQRTYGEQDGGGLTCIELRTGRRRWEMPFEPSRSHWPRPFVVAGGLLVATATDGELCALDLQTGEQAWCRRWPEWTRREGDSEIAPLVGRIFATEDRLVADVAGYVTALDPTTGETIWATPGEGQYLHGDLLFRTTSSRYEVRRLGDGSLEVEAEKAAGGPRSLSLGATDRASVVWVTDAHVYASLGRGLLAIDKFSGAYVWHHQPKDGAPVEGEVVSVSGRVYYRNGQRLFCLAPRDLP